MAILSSQGRCSLKSDLENLQLLEFSRLGPYFNLSSCYILQKMHEILATIF